MLTERSMTQTVNKLNRLLGTLKDRLFIPVGRARLTGLYQTREPLNAIPADDAFGPVPETWGGEGVYGWFRMDFAVPEDCAGRALYLRPHMGFYEATLWVNGVIHSNYAAKFIEGSHGNHWCNRFTPSAAGGETYRFDLECYAFHRMPGTQPLSHEETSFVFPVDGADVCLRDDEVMGFLFDLKTLLSLRAALPEGSFRRAQVENAMYEAHLKLFYDPDRCTPEEFRGGLRAALPYLKAELARKNGDDAPYIGLIGHSHMDTAWLWPLTETEKKCARTYANTLNLMLEYPEYRFVQSSAYHAEWLRRDYPELFSRIQQAVAQGRYEPNGGVWVECDCNLTGGEYMIRQFLWGQRFTQKYYGYTADCFWLPDTFGYSYAIPQIMKGCGVSYFLTTKIAWNDTNHFPLTTFYWQGLDGTKVFTHFNRIHNGPSPESYQDMLGDDMREKRVSGMRLFSFGRGDGGGGPEFEMLESARRLENLSGTARSGYTTVSEFMKELERTAVRPTTYAGELYLELHRGTLTNQHEIKHNNRFLERALHNMELALVLKAIREDAEADEAPAAPMTETLLVHQFHDILPGTSIHTVHEEAKASVSAAIEQADAATQRLLGGRSAGITLYNATSFDRQDTQYLSGAHPDIAGMRTQVFSDLNGGITTAVGGVRIPPFGSAALAEGEAAKEDIPFSVDGNQLKTPFAVVSFDDNMGIASLIDRRTGRNLVGGLPFNTFLMAEDVSAAWDNWDMDADIEEKFAPAGKLIDYQVVSAGTVELRIRCKWQLTEKSSITQDIVFDAASPLISFDTVMDWHEDHRFLKAAFDTAFHCDCVRSEIQFGYISRSNHRGTPVEKARFETCNHKYSDLSEQNGGLALLNDSKYGLSVSGGSMRLSLHKGGCLPDEAGDKGRHVCRYAILPHVGGFCAENVVKPAYLFNNPAVAVEGGPSVDSLCRVLSENVVIETVKPCEDRQRAYILRLYEAVGGYESVKLTFGHPVKALYECTMLESELNQLDPGTTIVFEPFKIRTFKVVY